MKRGIDDIMGLCCKISESRQIQVAVKHSAKGAAAAGGGAFLGGLLGGPPGIFLGGALGGAVGWWMTNDKFQPLPQIIMEMSPQQKKKLYSEVMAVLDNLDWVDLAQLIFLVMALILFMMVCFSWGLFQKAGYVTYLGMFKSKPMTSTFGSKN